MKGAAFPYRILLRADAHPEIVPAVIVQISRSPRDTPLSLICLVDSGASISLLPRDDGEVLGIDVEKGSKINVFGLGQHTFIAYRHEVYMRLGPRFLKVPLLFAYDNSAPRILGREGIFSQFLVLFDETKRRSGFVRLTSRNRSFLEKHVWQKLESPPSY